MHFIKIISTIHSKILKLEKKLLLIILLLKKINCGQWSVAVDHLYAERWYNQYIR
jgi:hypothetical protein